MFATTSLRARSRNTPKAGSAAIELVFVLPFVIALLLIIFTIAAMTMARMGLVTSVRNDAWQGRHQPWRGGPRYHQELLDVAVPRETERIVGPTQRWPSRAAVAAQDQRTMPVFLGGLEDAFAPSEYETVVLADSWDYQEIPFEPRGEHRRLEPTRKFYYFYDSPISFEPFRSMATFASAASMTGQNDARRRHEQAYERQQEELQRRKQEILAEIEVTQRQIDTLLAQLRQLENQDPRDAEAIDEVRNQIDHLESAIRTMENALTVIADADRSEPL